MPLEPWSPSQGAGQATGLVKSSHVVPEVGSTPGGHRGKRGSACDAGAGFLLACRPGLWASCPGYCPSERKPRSQSRRASVWNNAQGSVTTSPLDGPDFTGREIRKDLRAFFFQMREHCVDSAPSEGPGGLFHVTPTFSSSVCH